MINKTRLIVGAIAIGAIVSAYQLFSSNRVSTASAIHGQPQDSADVQAQSKWEETPTVSEPARTSDQTMPSNRSGPPSKRF